MPFLFFCLLLPRSYIGFLSEIEQKAFSSGTIVVMLYAQVVLALLVILLIVLQSRGAGLGTVWGGGGEFYGTRRGVEKLIFRITVVVTVLFTLVSLSRVILA